MIFSYFAQNKTRFLRNFVEFRSLSLRILVTSWWTWRPQDLFTSHPKRFKTSQTFSTCLSPLSPFRRGETNSLLPECVELPLTETSLTIFQWGLVVWLYPSTLQSTPTPLSALEMVTSWNEKLYLYSKVPLIVKMSFHLFLHFCDIPLIEYPIVYTSLHSMQDILFIKMLWCVILWGNFWNVSIDRYNWNDSIIESIEIGDVAANHRNLVGWLVSLYEYRMTPI